MVAERRLRPIPSTWIVRASHRKRTDAPSRYWRSTTRRPITRRATATVRPKTTRKRRNSYRITRRWPAARSTRQGPGWATPPGCEPPTNANCPNLKCPSSWLASLAARIPKSFYCRICWVMHTLPHHSTYVRHRLRWNSRTRKAYCFNETMLKSSIYSWNWKVTFSIPILILYASAE